MTTIMTMWRGAVVPCSPDGCIMRKVQEEPQDSGEQFSKLSRMSGTTVLLEMWREHYMNKIDLRLSVTMCYVYFIAQNCNIASYLCIAYFVL